MNLHEMDNWSPVILTLVTFIPLAGALLLILLPRRDRDIRVFSLVVSLSLLCCRCICRYTCTARRQDSNTRSTGYGFQRPTFTTTWGGRNLHVVGGPNDVSDPAVRADLVEIDS